MPLSLVRWLYWLHCDHAARTISPFSVFALLIYVASPFYSSSLILLNSNRWLLTFILLTCAQLSLPCASAKYTVKASQTNTCIIPIVNEPNWSTYQREWAQQITFFNVQMSSADKSMWMSSTDYIYQYRWARLINQREWALQITFINTDEIGWLINVNELYRLHF